MPLAVVGVILSLLFFPGFYEEIFALVFVGVIPFTNYTLPSMVMLVIYALFLSLLVYKLTRDVVDISDPRRREISSRARARHIVQKKTTPKVSLRKKLSPKKTVRSVVAREKS